MSQNNQQALLNLEADIPNIDLDDLYESPPGTQTRDPQAQDDEDGHHEVTVVNAAEDNSKEPGDSASNMTNSLPPNAQVIETQLLGVSSPSSITPVVIIGGLPPYEPLYSTVDEGSYAFYKAIRVRQTGQDPTLDIVKSNADRCTQKLYESFQYSKDKVTPLQQNMIDAWEKLLQDIPDKQNLLLQVSNLVFKCLTDLYEFGDNLRPYQVRRLEPTKQDKQMNALERLKSISSALIDTKTVCIDLLSGKDEITKFVAAPIAYESKKYPGKDKQNDDGVLRDPISAFPLLHPAQNNAPPLLRTTPVPPNPPQRKTGKAPDFTLRVKESMCGQPSDEDEDESINEAIRNGKFFAHPKIIKQVKDAREAERKRTASEAFGTGNEANKRHG